MIVSIGPIQYGNIAIVKYFFCNKSSVFPNTIVPYLLKNKENCYQVKQSQRILSKVKIFTSKNKKY